MKKQPKFILLIMIISFGVIGTILSLVQAAGSASYSLNPSSGGHDINTNFSVTVYENSGSEPVNAVQADLSYDQSKLQFVSIDTSGSAFDIGASATGGNGSVSIQRGKLGTLTGSQVVGSVTFKALVGSGSTAVSFAGSSQILRSSDSTNVWNGATTGGTYTLTSPAPPSTPPTSTPPPSTTGSTSGGTSSGSTSTSTSAGTSTPTSTSTTTQQADPSAPVPVAQDQSTNNSGYLVAIKVVDGKGKPINGATVTLDNKTVKSDTTGVASFIQVSPGIHQVTVKSKAGTVKAAVTVSSEKPNTEVQEFPITVKGKNTLLLVFEVGIGGLILLGLLYGVFRFLQSRRGQPSFKMNEPIAPSKIAPSAAPAQVITPTVITPNQPPETKF